MNFHKNIKISWQKLFYSNCRTVNIRNRSRAPAMNEAYFNHVESEQKIAISFRFLKEQESFRFDKVFNFRREVTEEIEKSLTRIKKNLEKELQTKKAKKKKKNQPAGEANTDDTSIIVELRDKNGAITDKCFLDLLDDFDSNPYILQLDETPFTVKYNWPVITALKLTAPLSGFYVYPSKLDIDYADKDQSEFIWYRGMMPANEKEEVQWEERSRGGFSLLLTHSDVGYRIKLVVIPKKANKVGPPAECISDADVQAGPGTCPFEERHLFTMDRLKDKSLRIASYNVLADYYADSEDGRTKLFFYCPEYAIKIDYRRNLLLKEIVGYNADIFCLQEVDFKVFEGDMIPILSTQNMQGVHNKKGSTPEGVATFFRTDRFELKEHFGLNIGETVKKHPACQELWAKLQSNELLIERMGDLGTTLQVVILQSKEFPEKSVAVANTHLYFHPLADHIRLLQAGFSMIIVQDIIREFKEKSGEKNVSLIFCGDFNSTPECGIYKLMTEGFVPEDFVDWKSNIEQEVKNVSLSQPLKMLSACGTPTYTNYTLGFKACLDYIFYQADNFKFIKMVEMPEEDVLNAHSALPSVVFPSDHVAIITELEFLESNVK